ncbi:MAG: gliding-motility protein MglA [Oligoflexales bacterium]
MAFTNLETKEINCKILYFGPKGSGKSTNLRSLYAQTSPEVKANLFQLVGPASQLYFEFLPLSAGFVDDFHIKVHLYTLPTHNIYPSLSSTIMRGIDGYVFVADSRMEMVAENIREYESVRRALAEQVPNAASLPSVFQLNKCDLINDKHIGVLKEEIGSFFSGTCEAVASKGFGTAETLAMVSKKVLEQLLKNRAG